MAGKQESLSLTQLKSTATPHGVDGCDEDEGAHVHHTDDGVDGDACYQTLVRISRMRANIVPND